MNWWKMQEVLHKIWKKLTYKYISDKYSLKLWNEIVKNYSKRNRHYHNLNHISDIIQKYYFTYEKELERPDEVLFAIFYHDIVYNVRRKDNELYSGIFMDSKLKDTKITESQLSFIFDCIYATRNHEKSESKDINYMLDMDMAILGQPWTEYNKYRKDVRREYKIYPNCMYKKGRKKALESFLKQDRIFKTDDFFNLYEKQARANISKELKFFEGF